MVKWRYRYSHFNLSTSCSKWSKFSSGHFTYHRTKRNEEETGKALHPIQTLWQREGKTPSCCWK